MHQNLDRFESHEGVIPYSCMDAITVLRKSLKDVASYKNVGLSKSLRLLVLWLGLGSAFLTVFSCAVFFVSALGLCFAILRLLSFFLASLASVPSAALSTRRPRHAPNVKEGARVLRRHKWKGCHHFFWAM